MPFLAASPLSPLVLDKPCRIELGNGAEGYEWSIPPGSILPPGLRLHPEKGILAGVPTAQGWFAFYVCEKSVETKEQVIQHYVLEVRASSAEIDTTRVKDLVAEFFKVGRTSPSQKIWFDEELDSQGRRVISMKFDDNGQERVIASITVS